MEVRIKIKVRIQEASVYKHAKEERAKARLQEITLQVKIATDIELNAFMQYLEHEYDLIHEQSCEKNQPGISVQDHVSATETVSAQLQIVRADNLKQRLFPMPE